MAIKIRKVGEVCGTNIVVVGSGKAVSEFLGILTSFEDVSEPADECRWQIEPVIGQGDQARKVVIGLGRFISKADYAKSKAEPILLSCKTHQGSHDLAFFRGRFFLPERPLYTEADKREVILRAKKLVYDEDTEIARLRSAVANIEAAIEYTKSGPLRSAIPDDVKMLVWVRDGGTCVHCGSKEKLQFDHIIPVAHGGSDTAENIQVLCAPCNLRKSASIVVPRPQSDSGTPTLL
jgi:hypothetical protein